MDGEQNAILAAVDTFCAKLRYIIRHHLDDNSQCLKNAREQFELQRQRVLTHNASIEEIVKLNVGGLKVSTTRTTMTRHEVYIYIYISDISLIVIIVKDCMLASLFSGRWSSIECDDEEYINFIDRSLSLKKLKKCFCRV